MDLLALVCHAGKIETAGVLELQSKHNWLMTNDLIYFNMT
jgi:hypothetical protein